MKVHLILEFENVKADSDEGASIVDSIIESCDNIQCAFDASDCYIDYQFED